MEDATKKFKHNSANAKLKLVKRHQELERVQIKRQLQHAQIINTVNHYNLSPCKDICHKYKNTNTQIPDQKTVATRPIYSCIIMLLTILYTMLCNTWLLLLFVQWHNCILLFVAVYIVQNTRKIQLIGLTHWNFSIIKCSTPK